MKNLKAKRNERKKKDLREAKEYKIRISPPPKKKRNTKSYTSRKLSENREENRFETACGRTVGTNTEIKRKKLRGSQAKKTRALLREENQTINRLFDSSVLCWKKMELHIEDTQRKHI